MSAELNLRYATSNPTDFRNLGGSRSFFISFFNPGYLLLIVYTPHLFGVKAKKPVKRLFIWKDYFGGYDRYSSNFRSINPMKNENHTNSLAKETKSLFSEGTTSLLYNMV